MQVQEKRRHRSAARPGTLSVREVGGVALLPERANEFLRKCSEYTGPARWLLPRPAPAPIGREICESFQATRKVAGPSSKRCWP